MHSHSVVAVAPNAVMIQAVRRKNIDTISMLPAGMQNRMAIHGRTGICKFMWQHRGCRTHPIRPFRRLAMRRGIGPSP